MGLIAWYEKRIKKRQVKESNVQWAFIGKALIVLSVGAMFSIELVRYGYFLLIAATFMIFSYLNNAYMSWYRKVKVTQGNRLLIYAGGFLLLLFFGIQTPQLPFKQYIWIIGILLLLPAAKDMLWGKNA